MDQKAIDAQELAEFDKICFGAEAMSLEEWLLVLGQNSRVFRIYRGGRVVGIAVAKWDAGIGYIYSYAVFPDYRKQGIGTKLVQLMLDYLAPFCRIVQAHTAIANEPSQSSLRKCGFQAVQYVTDFYEEYQDAILWEMRHEAIGS